MYFRHYQSQGFFVPRQYSMQSSFLVVSDSVDTCNDNRNK